MIEEVNIFPGRFQPFHNGHLQAIKDAYNENGLPTVIMYMKTTKQDERKPFNDSLIEEELNVIKESNKEYIKDVIWLSKPMPTIICRVLKENNYEGNLWIAGEDRISKYSSLIIPQKINELHVKIPKLWQSKRYSSATEVRRHIKESNIDKFKELMPKESWYMFEKFKSQINSLKDPIIDLKDYLKK